MTDMIKKTISSLANTFVRSAGTGLGTSLGKGITNTGREKKPSAPPNIAEVINKTGKAIDHPYNWDQIDHNSRKASEYVMTIAPAIGVTVVGFICLPVAAGAAAFAVAGSAVSVMVYGASNVCVVAGGAYCIASKLHAYTDKESDVESAETSGCENEPEDDQQEAI